MGMKPAVIAGTLILAGCVTPPKPIPVFPASPYFTDLHGCTDRLGQAHAFLDPIIDGFYSIAIFPQGIQMNNEVGAVEVLGNFPDTIHFIVSTKPYQIIWKTTGGSAWQPASQRQDNFPTTGCNFQ